MTATNGVSPACYLRFCKWDRGCKRIDFVCLYSIYFGQTLYNVILNHPHEVNQNTLGQKIHQTLAHEI
jgi:hypothetical protein